MTWRLLLALALTCAGPLRSGEELKTTGYVKNFFTASRLPEPLKLGDDPHPRLLGQSIWRLRLSLSYSPSAAFSFQAAYDLSPRIQDPFFFHASPFAAALEAASYRVADLRNPILPRKGDTVGSFGLYQNLDRLFVTIRLKFGDLIVGRQPMAWGSGRVVSPTDIIAPFSFYDLDKEERLGVDALRLRIPLSALSELEAGYVLGRDARFNLSAFFLRTKLYWLKTDLAILLLGFLEDFLLGVELARSIGGSGAWLEAACVFPGILNEATPKASLYARLTAGVDRSLGSRGYGFFEYHFNSAGAVHPGQYATLFLQPAYSRGTAYLLGRHYLSLGLTFQASPLISATGLVICNLSDGSLALSPQAEYNISENIYLGAGFFLGLGRPPETLLFDRAVMISELNSEFGCYPDFAFLSFRVYF